ASYAAENVKMYLLLGDPALEVRLDEPNSPPGTPDRPTGPVTGCFIVPYSYSTRALDPDGDQVKYIFNWGDGTASETSYGDSGTSTSLSHSWREPGTYFIRARAFDAEGEASGWSDEARILIYRPIKPS
ncbi:MAG: PKD domain-containing protein, partial [Methanothrix harundinacea]|nr:PKD domain-containing protein [Methanothrix harundinacea]